MKWLAECSATRSRFPATRRRAEAAVGPLTGGQLPPTITTGTYRRHRRMVVAATRIQPGGCRNHPNKNLETASPVDDLTAGAHLESARRSSAVKLRGLLPHG
jgi:hypothetical protein